MPDSQQSSMYALSHRAIKLKSKKCVAFYPRMFLEYFLKIGKIGEGEGACNPPTSFSYINDSNQLAPSDSHITIGL